MQRVSYHQNVFDLLDVEPPASAEAVGMIEACEGRAGRRLPRSLRDWYTWEGVVPLRSRRRGEESLWYTYSNMDHPQALAEVLEGFEQSWQAQPPEQEEDEEPDSF